KKLPLTKLGYEKLSDELQTLEKTARPKINERIKHARSFCDFHEDSEYEAALREQTKINERINELRHMLRYADVVQEQTYKKEVREGSKRELDCLQTGETSTYTIVSSEEAALIEDARSDKSPLEKVLKGKKEKAEIMINTPSGKSNFKINKIM